MGSPEAGSDWPTVRSWRKIARTKILGARVAIAAPVRAALIEKLIVNLTPFLESAVGPISFYWPIRGEPDLRPLMRRLSAAGVAVCLPVAIKLGEPLRFRPWSRGCAMTRGHWDIPIPDTDVEIVPRTLLAPLVGFAGGYRLGYGGGFFDRTLAAIGGQAIGVGFAAFRLPTIHPQPHDLPMAAIVTEAAALEALSGASPVCFVDEAPDAYAGYLAPVEIAARLAPLAPHLAPERKPLLDYLLWRLGSERPPDASTGSIDPAAILNALLPQIRDNAVHAGVAALRESLSLF